MANIIHIYFSEDLPTRKQNQLRYRMELAAWKAKWRDAEKSMDFDQMDYLSKTYEMLGMP